MLNHRNETHRLWVYKVPLYLPFSGGHWDSPGFFQSHPSDYPNQTAHGTHLTNVTSRPGLKDAQSTHLRISLFLDHDDFEANDEKTTGFFLGGRRRFSTVVIDDWWMMIWADTSGEGDVLIFKKTTYSGWKMNIRDGWWRVHWIMKSEKYDENAPKHWLFILFNDQWYENLDHICQYDKYPLGNYHIPPWYVKENHL